jgi:hypothetical protein
MLTYHEADRNPSSFITYNSSFFCELSYITYSSSFFCELPYITYSSSFFCELPYITYGSSSFFELPYITYSSSSICELPHINYSSFSFCELPHITYSSSFFCELPYITYSSFSFCELPYITYSSHQIISYFDAIQSVRLTKLLNPKMYMRWFLSAPHKRILRLHTNSEIAHQFMCSPSFKTQHSLTATSLHVMQKALLVSEPAARVPFAALHKASRLDNKNFHQALISI